MKKYLYKVFSFILSFIIFITSFLFFSVSVHAVGLMPPQYVQDLEKAGVKYLETGDNTELIDVFRKNLDFAKAVVLSCGAVCSGDALNYITASESVLDVLDYNNLHVDEQGNIIFGDNLVSQIKQALREYSEETNGFYLAPTVNVHEIPIEFFSSSSRYHTLIDIVDELGLAGVACNGSYVCNLSAVAKNGYSFVADGRDYDLVSAPVYCLGIYENSTWNGPTGLGGSDDSYWGYSECRKFDNIASNRLKWEDGTYPLNVNAPYKITRSLIFGYTNGRALTNLGSYQPSSWSSNNAQYAVWSSDGRRVRVWKSETAFINGVEGKRTVYFAKDFYDKTPTQITVSIDDMKDTVDKLDGVLNDLKDKIDSTTDESTIENLLQQILDEMKNQGGGGGGNEGGNEGGGSYDDSGLLAALSGYFDSVLSYLEQILSAIEALVWIEADDSNLTDDQKDLFGLIDKIWDNPETGSQEVADELSGSFLDVAKGITKKFPFSIPWDIHALFSVFARAGQSQPETSMLADGYGIMPLVGEPDDGEYDYPNGDGTSTVIKWDENPHDAPYFVLPLVVESYGIEEYIEVDLKDFQTVSILSRSLLAVLFAVFLIKFTITLMEFFKGGD